MPPIVFIDTEFTDFIHPQLLSLGMVTHDGQECFYAELDRNDPAHAGTFAHASDFVRHEGVLAQWGLVPGAGTRRQMGERAAHWLAQRVAAAGQALTVAYDYATDLELLQLLLEQVGQWEVLRPRLVPIDVGALAGHIDGQRASHEALVRLKAERGIGIHHALADALALRAACLALTEPTEGR